MVGLYCIWCVSLPPPPPPLVFTPVGFPFYQYTFDHKRTSGATRENVGGKRKMMLLLLASSVNIENCSNTTVQPDQKIKHINILGFVLWFFKNYPNLSIFREWGECSPRHNRGMHLFSSTLDWWCSPARTSWEYFPRRHDIGLEMLIFWLEMNIKKSLLPCPV